MKILFFLLIMTAPVLSLHADAYSDILKMNTVYGSTKSLHLEFDLLIRYRNGFRKDELHKCTLSQDGHKAYYKAMHTEYVDDGKNAVFVDHSQKLLIVGMAYEKTKQLLAASSMPFVMDSLMLKRGYNFQYGSGGKNTIVMTPKESNEFSVIHITLNPDYTLRKITCYYKEVPHDDTGITNYEITYTGQSFKPKVQYFASEKYADIEKTKITAKKAYASYKVIDKRLKFN